MYIDIQPHLSAANRFGGRLQMTPSSRNTQFAGVQGSPGPIQPKRPQGPSHPNPEPPLGSGESKT